MQIDMRDIERVLTDAWLAVREKVFADSDELGKRLARRRKPSLTRPIRFYCIAIKANDRRINRMTAIMMPEKAHLARPGMAHEVVVDKRLVERLVERVELRGWRSHEYAQAARKLGVSASTIGRYVRNGKLNCDRIHGLGGKKIAVPLVWARDGECFDPNSTHACDRPDPAWGPMWMHLALDVPDEFAQTIERVPVFAHHVLGSKKTAKRSSLKRVADDDAAGDPYGDAWFDDEPEDDPNDTVGIDDEAHSWMKLGDWAPPHETRVASEADGDAIVDTRAPDATPGMPARSAANWRGWRWVCPGCGKRVATIFYPTAPPLITEYLNDEPRIAPHEADAPPTPPGTFACHDCHHIHYWSRLNHKSWNMLVCYLSGGMLYGKEVEKPAWWEPHRKRAYTPHRPHITRGHDVERLLIAGKRYVDIATEMGIALATVQGHVRRIYRRRGVHSRRELIATTKTQDVHESARMDTNEAKLETVE